MKLFEARLRAGSHPSFIEADTAEEAAKIAAEKNSRGYQTKYKPEDFTFIQETHKVRLETVMTPFTYCPDNGTDVPLEHLEEHIERLNEYGDFIEQPEFQRAHVWTEEQQVKFVEFFLRGGKSGRIIYTNRQADWNYDTNRAYPTVLVDGLQRLTALRKFMRGDLKVFGGYTVNDFQYIGNDMCLRFVRNSLKTDKEVMQWYIDLNEGLVPHTEEEIQKVKDMLNKL